MNWRHVHAAPARAPEYLTRTRTYKFSDVTKIRARPTFCYSNVRSNGSHKYAIHGPLSGAGAADTEAQGARVGSQEVKETSEGLDFFFAQKQEARKLVDFLQTVVPCR